ncbi:hypothetical protein [Lacticaseibacillus sp. GG6-2]
MSTAFDKIPVPENLVNAAIATGVGQAQPRRHQRRIRRGLLVTAILMATVGLMAPVTLQAGGLVPAYKQLLDQPLTTEEHLDPTINHVLGDLDNPQHYHALKVPAQSVNGIKVQPIGTLATAGVIAVLVDYQGQGIDPDALKSPVVDVHAPGMAKLYDISGSTAGKVSVGHYRQVLAFYPPTTGNVKLAHFDLTLSHINGSDNALHFNGLQTADYRTQTRLLNATKTLTLDHQPVTVALTRVQAASETFVLDYQTSFQSVDATLARYLKEAAWVSTGKVLVNGHTVGDLDLGVGGSTLAVTTGATTTARFQSTFASQYRDSQGQRHALPANATVQFAYEVVTSHHQRQTVTSFSIPANQLLLE